MKPVPKLIEQRDRKRAKETAWRHVRAQVLGRDHHRCRACGQRDHVDVHHKQLRSAGGESTPKNLLCLCRYCHSLVHAYRLFIVGDSADGKLRFERVTR